MSDSKSPENVRQLFAAIEASFREDDEDSFKLSAAETDRQLAEQCINPQSALNKLNEILECAHAQARLDKAKAQRQRFLELLPSCLERLKNLAAPMKEEVLAIIQGISPSRTEAVEAYFRKFEQSSEKDIRSLMEDLEMLRAMKGEVTKNDDAKPHQG